METKSLPSEFLGLPRELRDKIYDKALSLHAVDFAIKPQIED